MINKIEKLIHNKRVLILGFGREGQSTYHMLKQAPSYLQLDIADKLMDRPDIGEEHNFLNGDSYMDSMDSYDIVFKSPGIVLPKNPEEYSCCITSQTDVYLSEYSRQTIGITGTKGKSTVSSLLYHTLHTNGVESLFAGNIGIPVFDVIDKITPNTVVVLELSCHQLEYCYHSPSMSILLNVYEDHLDHYKTFENYAKSKTHIYKHQFTLDTLFTIPEFLPDKKDCPARMAQVTTDCLPFERLEAVEGAKLRGNHNLINCAFVYQVCQFWGISDEAFVTAVENFQPLPHRLEFIGTKHGVDYYDDSISTTVESAISAVKSIGNAKTLLLGGMDRGIDYTPLVDFLLQSDITHVILMYESGKRIYDMLKAKESRATSISPEFIHVDNLYQATQLASKYTQAGTACILSPASASYGDFKNFEERGNVFKELVQKLSVKC